MASKKEKKNKTSANSKKIFDLIRNYCKAPWVSTDKELPKEREPVLLAYYMGADIGYSYCIGWMTQIELPKKKEEDPDDLVCGDYFGSDVEKASRAEVFLSPRIDVGNPDGGLSRRSFYENAYSNLYNGYDSIRYDELRKGFRVIKKDNKEYAIVWLMYSSTNHETAMFSNSKGATSALKDPLSNAKQPGVNLYQPDFWMYIPEVK